MEIFAGLWRRIKGQQNINDVLTINTVSRFNGILAVSFKITSQFLVKVVHPVVVLAERSRGQQKSVEIVLTGSIKSIKHPMRIWPVAVRKPCTRLFSTLQPCKTYLCNICFIFWNIKNVTGGIRVGGVTCLHNMCAKNTGFKFTFGFPICLL